MDVKTALMNTVTFPLTSTQAEVIAVERGLELDADFTAEVGKSPGFCLAKADMIRVFITSPNVSEGGVSISISDRKTLIGIANGIYSRYGEPLIQEEHPKVTPIDF